MRICAVIAEDTVSAARHALDRAASQADLAELRLDYLRDFDFSSLSALHYLLDEKPLPVIITCRSIEEGGKQRIDDHVRIPLLVEGVRSLADFCDIEAAHYDRAANLFPDLSRLIVSYHNFHKTPDNLDAIYDNLSSRPAAMHKIAVKANSVQDVLPVFRQLNRAKAAGRDLIAISMGEPGLVTRILGPAWGSFLTYGSLDPGNATAAGQPGCLELREVYRLNRISRSTSVLALVGSPVSHSASPRMHNAAAEALGLDLVYVPIEVQDLATFVTRLAHPQTREIDWRLAGFSVTIPHKEAIVPLLDGLDEVARGVGAVNTVVIREGKLFGFNTDVAGSMSPLEKITKLAGAACAVVGSGGAARAVAYGLARKGAQVTVYARSQEKAAAMARDFSGLGVRASDLASLTASTASIIINTTPVGTSGRGRGETVVPPAALARRDIAYDLVYNPLETQFLRDAREAGCKTISGIEMLAAQAEAQFLLWTGKQAPPGLMLQEGVKAVASRES